MQKKLYVGGLPWELDRIGLLNYLKAVLESNDIIASYELPFINSPIIHPNASVRVVDVFVANDRETGKSRGFGFITLDLVDEATADSLFETTIELLNERVVLGIRGPRDLIVNEAEPRTEDGGGRRDAEETTEVSDDDLGDIF